MTIVLAALVLSACGSLAADARGVPSASDTAERCADARAHESAPRLLPLDGTLVGAFVLAAAQLAEQDENRGGPTGPHPLRSEYRDYAADTPITLCFFDGFIAAPGGPPPQPPATWRPYDRYSFTVDPSGRVRSFVAGRQDTLLVRPHLP